jgi:AcrR family transcriptional regulator
MLSAAVGTVAERGPSGLSLRALAAQAGVSHAAPIHHFKDKAGLFTAIATQGFDLLADELGSAWDATGDFLEVGVRYVVFALSHRGHFEVMFRPDLWDQSDSDLEQARHRAFSFLVGPVAVGRQGGTESGAAMAALASWSTVHGLATLALAGNLSEGVWAQVNLSDPEAVARAVLLHLRVV